MVNGSELLSSAAASIKQSKSQSKSHAHAHSRCRQIHDHPSFVDAIALLTLAFRLSSNDLAALGRRPPHHSAAFSSQEQRDPLSSSWTSQLPVWPKGSGISLRSKMRACSLDHLALAAYWLNDYAYRSAPNLSNLQTRVSEGLSRDVCSATLLCHALRCEGSSGDDEERCV